MLILYITDDTCELHVPCPVKDDGAGGTIKDQTVISAAAIKCVIIPTDKSSDLFCLILRAFDLDQKVNVGCRPVPQKDKTRSQ